jgi:hypothetical protein
MDASVKPECEHIEGESNLHDVHVSMCDKSGEWQAKDKAIVVADTGAPTQVYTFTPRGKGIAMLTFVYR